MLLCIPNRWLKLPLWEQPQLCVVCNLYTHNPIILSNLAMTLKLPPPSASRSSNMSSMLSTWRAAHIERSRKILKTVDGAEYAACKVWTPSNSKTFGQTSPTRMLKHRDSNVGERRVSPRKVFGELYVVSSKVLTVSSGRNKPKGQASNEPCWPFIPKPFTWKHMWLCHRANMC